MAKTDYSISRIMKLPGALIYDFYRNQIGKRIFPLPPSVIVMNVVYRCDARCVMCSNWKRGSKRELTVEEYNQMFQDEVFSKVENVNISGGEPTLRKDLLDIVRCAHRCLPNLKKIGINSTGINVNAATNLENIVNYCHEQNLGLSIRISLDGVGKMHDEIRRVPNAFEKAMRTINHLKKLENEKEFSFGLSATFSQQNYLQCNELHQFTTELNADAIYAPALESDESYNSYATEGDINIPPEGRALLTKFYKDRVIEGSILDGSTYFYTKYIKHLNTDKILKRDMPCPFADQGLVIEPDGDLKYCLNSSVIGHATEEGSSTVYYKKNNLDERKGFPSTICRDCMLPCFSLVSARKQVFPYLGFLLDVFKIKCVSRIKRIVHHQSTHQATKHATK